MADATGRVRAGAGPDLRALDALYAELPSVECNGLCSEACHYIGMTKVERERIMAAGGPEIQIWQGPCPALSIMGRCTVYENRPAICRMFGVVEDLRCPYGCEPERFMTREEARDFMTRLYLLVREDTI